MKKTSRFYVIINLTLVIVSHLLGQQGCCKGGRFFEFDPSNNAAEGAGTNFVAEGYEANLVPVDGFNYYVIAQK